MSTKLRTTNPLELSKLRLGSICSEDGLDDHTERLSAAIIAAGLPAPPAGLKMDGSFTRWGGNGSKPCWCVAHRLNNGHLAAAFGDWRTGSTIHFRSWENGTPADPNEAQRLLDEYARRQKLADEEAARAKAATAKREAEIWEFLPASGDSEYLKRKGVGAYGIRFGADHYGQFIAVPMRTVAGKFTAFQRIYGQKIKDGRDKDFPKHAEQKGAYHLIGTLEPGGVLYLVEGYATGVTVYEATGKPAAVCFTAGNLRAVADALKAIYPELQLIVAADNDQWKAEEKGPEGKPKGNAGIKAAYAVVYAHPGTRVAIPRFDNLDTSDKPTDFNDLAALTGLENVGRQLEQAFVPKPKPNGGNGQTEPVSIETTAAYSLIEGSGKNMRLVRPSNAAKILARYQRTVIAYDLTARAWLKYTGTHWKELNDDAVFTLVDRLIDAGGTDEFGYGPDYVRGTIDLLRSRLAVDRFDASSSLVPFINGVFDLKTKELHPHNPNFHLTWCLPFAYDPDATCEPVITWLHECVKGDPLQVELLRAFLKAVLTGRSDFQRYLELIGPGGGGKGTFTRLAESIVGSRNTHATSLKRLETNRFETAQLYNVRLCVITDSERYAGEVSVLKAMTGQDTLPNERKHKQHGEPFRYHGMVLISGNENIGSADLTSGLQRRRITVRFDNPVAADQRRDLEEEFVPLLPGVVAWCLSMDDDRMRQLLVETSRYVPTLAKVAMDTLVETNPIAAWAQEYIVLDSKAETPIGRLVKSTINTVDNTDFSTRRIKTEYEHADEWLYPSYYRYCEGAGSKAVANRRFTALLTDLLKHQLKLTSVAYLPKVSSTPSRFKGIRLRGENDQNAPGVFSGLPPGNMDSKDSKGQQKDSKRTANGEYETAKREKSIFPDTQHSDSKLTGQDSKVVDHDSKNASHTDFAVPFTGSISETETYEKICRPFAVHLPSFAVQQDSKTANMPPDFGDGPPDFGDSFNALVESLQSGVISEPEPPPAADDSEVW